MGHPVGDSTPSTDDQGAAALLSGAAKSFTARAITLPVIAVAGLLVTRVVIDALGSDGYASYALIVGLASLVPFLDLGLGAAVTDAVARHATSDPVDTAAVLRRSQRILVGVGVGIAIAAWLLAAFGIWHLVLGVSANSSVEVAAAVGFTFFGAGLPLSLGARVLQGLGRNHLAVSLQSLQALTALLVVAAAASTSAPFWVFVAGPFLGTFVVAAASWALARRSLQSLNPSTAPAQDAPPRSPAIALYAVPMLIIALAEPVAWQADRIILSHASTLNAVAQYSLVFALFGPLNSLIAASGGSLWPVFARRRTVGAVTGGDVARTTAGFAGVGLLLSAAMILIGPLLVRFMARDAVEVPWHLFWAFAALLLLVAMWIPTGMVLTDPQGLRIQAGLVIGQVIINIPLSIVLAARWGAIGPVVASAVAIAVSNCVGWLIFSVRRAPNP